MKVWCNHLRQFSSYRTFLSSEENVFLNKPWLHVFPEYPGKHLHLLGPTHSPCLHPRSHWAGKTFSSRDILLKETAEVKSVHQTTLVWKPKPRLPLVLQCGLKAPNHRKNGFLRMEYFHVLHSTEKFPTIDTCNLVTKLKEMLITFTVSFAVLLPSVAALESAAVPAHACQTPRRDLPSFSFRKTAGTGQFFTKTRFNNVTRQKHWGRPSEDHRFEGKGVPYGGLWGLTLWG